MPAAAVIPAPIAYIKVVAVKKLVVEFWENACGPPSGEHCTQAPYLLGVLSVIRGGQGNQDFYFEEIRVFKAGFCLNTLAWNNGIGPWFYFVGFRDCGND